MKQNEYKHFALIFTLNTKTDSNGQEVVGCSLEELVDQSADADLSELESMQLQLVAALALVRELCSSHGEGFEKGLEGFLYLLSQGKTVKEEDFGNAQ